MLSKQPEELIRNNKLYSTVQTKTGPAYYQAKSGLVVQPKKVSGPSINWNEQTRNAFFAQPSKGGTRRVTNPGPLAWAQRKTASNARGYDDLFKKAEQAVKSMPTIDRAFSGKEALARANTLKTRKARMLANLYAQRAGLLTKEQGSTDRANIAASSGLQQTALRTKNATNTTNAKIAADKQLAKLNADNQLRLTKTRQGLIGKNQLNYAKAAADDAMQMQAARLGSEAILKGADPMNVQTLFPSNFPGLGYMDKLPIPNRYKYTPEKVMSYKELDPKNNQYIDKIKTSPATVLDTTQGTITTGLPMYSTDTLKDMLANPDRYK
jgi:hypothetical protein